MPQSLAVKSAMEAYECCRQSVDLDSWQWLSVADTVDIGVLVSQLSAGDCEITLTQGKSQSQQQAAVFQEYCQTDRDTAE